MVDSSIRHCHKSWWLADLQAEINILSSSCLGEIRAKPAQDGRHLQKSSIASLREHQKAQQRKLRLRAVGDSGLIHAITDPAEQDFKLAADDER